MSKIRLLSAQEIKLIAAGEVVESPASIIKELIENACDAQSSTISLSIEDGGISSIIVSDNGTGITEEDLPLALLPHATSKLNAFIDGYIENNNHYGFRGEALAAISGVSEVTIHTKTAYTTHGYAITSKESKINDISPIGCNEGTTIFVKDLFGSIPARKKYLPSKGTLEKQIAYTFQGLALGKPTINISYKKDNKIIEEILKSIKKK